MVRRGVVSAMLLALVTGGLPAVAAAHDGDPGRRAAALVRQMTLDEKISLVHGTGFITGNGYTGFTPAIPRLGIPAFYLADGPNGVGNGAKGVTAFPAAINNAASWDTRLLRRYGTVLGAEHAGKGNDVALAPTMNILRVPGWGRAFETFSEEPELAGDVAAAEIRGIQSAGRDRRRQALRGQQPGDRPPDGQRAWWTSGRCARSTRPSSRRPSRTAACAR